MMLSAGIILVSHDAPMNRAAMHLGIETVDPLAAPQ